MAVMRQKFLRIDPRYFQIAALGTLLFYGCASLGFEIDALQITLTLTTAIGVQLLLASLTRTNSPLDVRSALITGLSLLLLFVALEQAIGWPKGGGAVTITLAHITFCMAYVTVVVQSRLVGFDESLEEAAMDLGARPAKVFFRITLPLIVPALVSGWLLAFTLSWDDLVISQFVAGPGSSTLPMVIFSKVRLGVSPDVNALATIMVLIVASGIVVSSIWMRYQNKRRERDMRLAAAANL